MSNPANTVSPNIVPIGGLFSATGACEGLVGPAGEIFSVPLVATNDVTTNATEYVTFLASPTGGTINVSSTKLTFNPSTGVLTVAGGILGGTF